MNQNRTRIKLKTFQIDEKKRQEIEIRFNNFQLSDYNLLIGDNSQGKTRLFRIFNFFPLYMLINQELFQQNWLLECNLKFLMVKICQRYNLLMSRTLSRLTL